MTPGHTVRSTAGIARWGSYTRISDDPNELERGVGRQKVDNERAIGDRGGVLIKEYKENDTSAWKKRKLWRTDPDGHEYAIFRVIRPVWHEALRDLRAGVIDALMVYDLDRLARDPRDLEDAIEIVQYYNRRVEGPRPGQIDLTTDHGIAMARVLTAMNNKASADTARRVKRAHLENAENGATPGGRRPFGYSNDDRNKLDTREAEYARRAAQMLIDGHSLGAVAKMLNEAGVRTSGGHVWSSGAVRQYFAKAYRLIGVRALRGEIVLKDGRPVRGEWEPLLTEHQFDLIQEILDLNRERQRARGGRPGSRKYLLTGIMRCADCGGNMTANTAQNGNAHNYVCRGRKRGFDHTLTICGSNGLDALIVDLVSERMRHEVLKPPKPEWAGAARLEEVQREIKQSLAALKAKTISAQRAMAIIDILEAEESDLLALERSHRADVHRAATSRVDAEVFRAAEVSVQREIIADYIEFIVVSRPTARNNGRRGGLDLSRIAVQWRTED